MTEIEKLRAELARERGRKEWLLCKLRKTFSDGSSFMRTHHVKELDGTYAAMAHITTLPGSRAHAAMFAQGATPDEVIDAAIACRGSEKVAAMFQKKGGLH